MDHVLQLFNTAGVLLLFANQSKTWSPTSICQSIQNLDIINPVVHKTKPMDGMFLEAFLVKCTARFQFRKDDLLFLKPLIFFVLR